jgi:predicted HicB family RNase H-like nuclease
MDRATIPVKLPPSPGKAARKLAEEDGVSLNQWVSVGGWRIQSFPES